MSSLWLYRLWLYKQWLFIPVRIKMFMHLQHHTENYKTSYFPKLFHEYHKSAHSVNFSDMLHYICNTLSNQWKSKQFVKFLFENEVTNLTKYCNFNYNVLRINNEISLIYPEIFSNTFNLVCIQIRSVGPYKLMNVWSKRDEPIRSKFTDQYRLCWSKKSQIFWKKFGLPEKEETNHRWPPKFIGKYKHL